ncbi:MAG: prenyltransferase [Methanomassiliicoccales archaeon]|nr:prenyltransferase [Methanomassiliicoccales archaeon]
MVALSGTELTTRQSWHSATFMAKTWAMVRLSRPHMFVAGALLYVIGVALANAQVGTVDVGLALSGLVAVFFGQISGQIANDYWDRIGDGRSRRTLFSGGSGILVKGLLSPGTALRGAIASCAIATLLAVIITFWFDAGILTVPIILGGTLGGWLYSAEPIRLVSTGLGEVIVSGVVSFFPIMAGFYLQTGTLTFDLIATSVLTAVFLFPVFLSVEFPDYDADESSGKRNLLVRSGMHATTRLYAGTMLFTYVALIAFVSAGWVAASALIILATLPVAFLGVVKALTLSRSDLKGTGFVTLTSMVVFVMTMALMLFSVMVG